MMSHWEEKYRANTTPWDRGGSSPALHEWLASGALRPGRVLIPGCGRGHEALDLARAGFEVTALDIAPTALRLLQEQLDQAGVTAELVCADALSWCPGTPFDAIYEQTCLCALDPTLWPDYERQLHAWLKPGGRLYALFMQTGRVGGPPHHCGLADMRKLLPESRWTWTEEPHQQVTHPDGIFEYAALLTRR
jgi:SAM-dependent methyltransferase